MEVVMGNKKVQEVVTSLFSSCQISSEVYFLVILQLTTCDVLIETF